MKQVGRKVLPYGNLKTKFISICSPSQGGHRRAQVGKSLLAPRLDDPSMVRYMGSALGPMSILEKERKARHTLSDGTGREALDVLCMI